MTTPTKEQIDKIVPLVKRQFEKTKNIWIATKTAITEWEKIRNSPK